MLLHPKRNPATPSVFEWTNCPNSSKIPKPNLHLFWHLPPPADPWGEDWQVGNVSMISFHHSPSEYLPFYISKIWSSQPKNKKKLGSISFLKRFQVCFTTFLSFETKIFHMTQSRNIVWNFRKPLRILTLAVQHQVQSHDLHGLYKPSAEDVCCDLFRPQAFLGWSCWKRAGVVYIGLYNYIYICDMCVYVYIYIWYHLQKPSVSILKMWSVLFGPNKDPKNPRKKESKTERLF